MTRAKTQGPGGKPPRAATQGAGKSKRAVSTAGLFNELEAAIDALDADTSSPRHAGAKIEAAREAAKVEAAKAEAAKVEAAKSDAVRIETAKAEAAKAEIAKTEAAKKIALPPPKRAAPGPTPASAAAAGAHIKSPFPPRTTPPKPPPGAERASAIRARESRAQSEIGLEEAEEIAIEPSPPSRLSPMRMARTPDPDEVRRVPPRPPPPETTSSRPVDAVLRAPGTRALETASPRPLAPPIDAGPRPPGMRPPEPRSSRQSPSMRPPPPKADIDADGLPRVTPPPKRPSDPSPARPADPDDGLPRVSFHPPGTRANAQPQSDAPGARRRPGASDELDADVVGLPRVSPPRPASEIDDFDADADGLPRVSPPSAQPRSSRQPVARPDSEIDEFDADADGLPRVSLPSAQPRSPRQPVVRADSDDDFSMARPISEPASGHSIDIDLEDSSPAAHAYRPISEGARAISVGETVADDLVLEGDALAAFKPLAIAILEDPPQIAAAKQAIAVAGHKVAAAASGAAGIEQLKSLLRSGSVDVLLVGIPGGEPLIDTALALAPKRPVVIAVTAGKAVDGVRRAASVGADLSISRPIDVERLAPILLAATRLVAERHPATTTRGSETTLRARGLDAVVEAEPGALQPFELFQRVLELELKRSKRYGYPIAVALFSVDVGGDEPPPGVRGILRARAGNALIHSIRDIDLATEVDQERFLVLLPYTTLAGAAEVARRILHAVTSGNPITAGGKPFPPKIVGAVAGASPGQPLSFSRLMRDATQALEQARRDGAELAVPIVRGPES